MPWMTVIARRPRTFVPPEAVALGDHFRKAAKQLRAGGSDFRGVSTELAGSWAGLSRERFMLDFGSRPGRLESAAEWAETMAGQLERIEVTVWETEENQVWVPETAGR